MGQKNVWRERTFAEILLHHPRFFKTINYITPFQRRLQKLSKYTIKKGALAPPPPPPPPAKPEYDAHINVTIGPFHIGLGSLSLTPTDRVFERPRKIGVFSSKAKENVTTDRMIQRLQCGRIIRKHNSAGDLKF